MFTARTIGAVQTSVSDPPIYVGRKLHMAPTTSTVANTTPEAPTMAISTPSLTAAAIPATTMRPTITVDVKTFMMLGIMKVIMIYDY